MRSFVGRTFIACLGLAVSACQDSPEHEADPVVERDTGSANETKPDEAAPDCVGLPEGIGSSEQAPRVELPGPARALASGQSKTWVCGENRSGGGYVAALGLQDASVPSLLEQRDLDLPCQGMVLGSSGLALLLQGGQVLWLPMGQAKLASFGASTQSSAIQLRSDRPLRGVWSAERESLYLAAGAQGILRLYPKDSVLVQDLGFVGPALEDARDVALLGDALLVADSRHGLTLWDLEASKERAQWRDLAYSDRPGVQRVLVKTGQPVAVAAGHAGRYLLDYDPDKKSFELVQHELFAEPVMDVATGPQGLLTLTASRLYEEESLLYQSYPDLAGQEGFESLALGAEQGLWLARASSVEYWAKPEAAKGARLVPLLGFGTALHGVSGNATGELTFEVQGEGGLWVARPEAPEGSGLRVEALGWPTWAPSCAEHSRFEAGERFSLRVRASNPEKLAKTVPFFLRSSDPVHARLQLAVDLDTPRPRERLGGSLPKTPLVNSSGYLRPIQGEGVWNWLEFVPSQQLSSPESLEAFYQLAELVQTERRNGRATLVASVVVGGQYPLLDPVLWAQLERLRDLGLAFYFDERFAMHRSFAHLPNGRLYPLRVLVDRASKIRYLDQQIGSATAMARYRELKFLR